MPSRVANRETRPLPLLARNVRKSRSFRRAISREKLTPQRKPPLFSNQSWE
jgi:hypothetical protein